MRTRTSFLVLSLSALLIASTTLVGGCTDDPTSDSSPISDSTTAADSPCGVTQVVLAWDEAIDLDLEIWSGDGEGALTSAGLENEDVIDGTQGTEWIDFTGELADGEYVVSVYFAEETDIVPSAIAHLTVTKTDGSTLVRTKEIMWEEGWDQWHGFRIDAETGDIEDIDEFIVTGMLDE